ncbi:transposase [Streptomyces sp. NPDC001165]|uniref:transposase n=1 Tax=Streptomyces sp. NPDC001165 TaxID=3364546 RepID=UPI003696587D
MPGVPVRGESPVGGWLGCGNRTARPWFTSVGRRRQAEVRPGRRRSSPTSATLRPRRWLEGRLTRLVERHAPQLLEVVGIGPDTAVTLLITIGDNPQRLGSEASFAALCGVSPVERSSGSRQYRRLNRGGDRQANAALHRIVQTRLRVDPRTQEYYERRSKEGKTRREIVRSLKRYAAREVFHLVRPVQPQPPP